MERPALGCWSMKLRLMDWNRIITPILTVIVVKQTTEWHATIYWKYSKSLKADNKKLSDT